MEKKEGYEKLDGGDLEQPKKQVDKKEKSKHKKESEFALRKLLMVTALCIFFSWFSNS